MDRSKLDAPGEAAQQERSEEPQRRSREGSGILGEPAAVDRPVESPTGSGDRPDPTHEQVPTDHDQWRR